MQRQDRNIVLPYDKLKILGLICILVLVVTIPVTIPHFSHPTMIYHILLHIASLAIAIFLSYIAVSAYVRAGRARLLFMALGFVTLATLEILLLLSATGSLEQLIVPMLNVELAHVILLLMITLFGVGVLKVN